MFLKDLHGPPDALPVSLPRHDEDRVVDGEFELAASLQGTHEVYALQWRSPYDGFELDMRWIPSEEVYRVRRVGEEFELWNLSARSDLRFHSST